jgi:uncharacterized protein (TIGR03066 family)
MNLHRVVLAGVAFLALALVGVADTTTAKKLVGVWEVTKSKDAPPGATVEFTSNGKMMLRAKLGDKTLAIDGTYVVKDNKIVATLTFQGKTKTDTGKIRKLTATELSVEDEKGDVENYKRLTKK